MRPATALVLCLCLSAAAAPAGGPGAAPPHLRRYDTPYYVVHTDLPPGGAAEAVARMAKLGEALRLRTRDLGFNGRIEHRLPFYLYANHADYVAAAKVPPESAGVFLGDRLVAAATDARGSTAWHVVQHEAFHQFPAAADGTELPAWLNEGLGEYFGEALFTGDGYVTGVVPAWRLKRVRRSLDARTFPPLARFVALSHEGWNRDMTIARYDQAWSLVQFLLHGGGRNYRERVVRYVRALGAGESAQDAWDAAFRHLPGSRIESDWQAYWFSLPAEGTPDVYAEATVATITSFIARAAAAGQSFKSFDAFTRSARAGELRGGPREDWLPPSLLLRALDSLPEDARCYLQRKGNESTLIADFPAGGAWAGTFSLLDGRVATVTVNRAQLGPSDP